MADTLNSFGARETLSVGGNSYTIYNLAKAAAALGADLDKLPFAHRILLENLLRYEDGKEVTIIGELIDTACFVTSDGDAKGKDHAECAAKCMGTGVPAGILPKDSKEAHDMMFLLTNPKPLAPHAAKTIKVVGIANEHMHAFDVKKLYVQAAGGKWQEVKLDDEHHKMGGNEAGHDDGHGDHKHAGGDSGQKGAKSPAAK